MYQREGKKIVGSGATVRVQRPGPVCGSSRVGLAPEFASGPRAGRSRGGRCLDAHAGGTEARTQTPAGGRGRTGRAAGLTRVMRHSGSAPTGLRLWRASISPGISRVCARRLKCGHVYFICGCYELPKRMCASVVSVRPAEDMISHIYRHVTLCRGRGVVLEMELPRVLQ